MKLRFISIIELLSDSVQYKIWIDGHFVGQFAKDQVPYEYLKKFVKSIEPLFGYEQQHYLGINLVTNYYSVDNCDMNLFDPEKEIKND